jgi:hypothetical protein
VPGSRKRSSARSGRASPVYSNKLRYPLVAIKAPVLVARIWRRIPRRTVEVRHWWREVTTSEGTPPERQLREASSDSPGGSPSRWR